MTKTKTREQLVAMGKLGAAARWAKRPADRPYDRPFLEFLAVTGHDRPSRATWRVFWKVADGLPLEPDELPIFRLHTGRETPPTTPALELWVPAGRRVGKSENMIRRATWRAMSFDRAPLQAGELAVIPVVASDRAQARNSLNFLRGLAAHPLVAPYVQRVLKESVEFRTGCVVQVHTASFRATRGYTMIDAILEECAFYQSEDSANPDEEIANAIRPALITVPGSRLYGISSPYARRGILWRAYEEHFGRDGDVLVWNMDTRSGNPTVDAREIERAFARDPAVAASEYGQDGRVSFRTDVESFLSREAVEAVTVPGRRELPPAGFSYAAFTDPSGGSQDEWTLAIAHVDGARVILDALRTTRPPFSPEQVVVDYALLLRRYGIMRVEGDRYGGIFPVDLFAKQGIGYVACERTKSDLYRELLPLVNAGTVELLDEPKLAAQLIGLERRVARGGKDSIDHAPGGHDDLANSAAGVLVTVGATSGWDQFMRTHDATGRPFASAAPQPAATRTILRPAVTSRVCACGAVFDVRDDVRSCPQCGGVARGVGLINGAGVMQQWWPSHSRRVGGEADVVRVTRALPLRRSAGCVAPRGSQRQRRRGP